MTDRKKVSGKLTDEMLELGLDILESRSVKERPVEKPGPKQQEKKKSTVKEAAEKLLQRTKPKAESKSAGKQKAKAPEKGPVQAEAGKQQSTRSPKKRSSKKEEPLTSKATAKDQEKAKSSGKAEKAPEKPKQPAKRGSRRSTKATQPVGATIELSESGRARLESLEAASKTGKGHRKQKEQRKPPVRIVPLGGLLEVGKNMTCYECQGDMFIVDCGMTFPDDEMLGVDLVLPDFTYAVRNQDRLKGIVITHGHEDHIGALPYFLKQVNVPVYATRLTLGLIENKLREHGLYGRVKLVQIAPRETIKLGCMEVEFIRVNHSIPDAVALAIHTPAGVIVQTGDFKIDYTPIMGDVIDLPRFGELGSRGVLALLSDSTNAERPGFTPTEQTVRGSFDKLFQQAGARRIIIATFSSNISRIQLICEAAAKYGRKVAVSGRSMVNAVAVSTELGYLDPPKDVLIDIDDLGRYRPEDVVLITTGSQGEPMSALSRMASGEHRKVNVTRDDFIIISARPIPGNEKTVGRVINELLKLGAEVVYEAMYETHASGHASQEDLQLMMSLVRPKYFVPVHGEYKHLKKNASLAMAMGIPSDRILIGDIGKVMETDGVDMKFVGSVPAGQVFVDGLGVGDVGSIVLRDRKHLAEDGLIIAVVAIDSVSGQIAAGPDIISRGFVYVREAEHMMAEAREIVRRCVEDCASNGLNDWGHMKTVIKDKLSSYLYNQTKRSPMILPVIQEI